jgi:tetratricopeptide (TPR) repeat protein
VYYFYRGYAYEQKGLLEKAINDHTRVISLKPDYHDAFINRGRVYMRNAQLDLAIKDFTNAIQLNNDMPFAYYHRGSIYLSLGKYEKAEKDIEKALEISPTNPTAMMRMIEFHSMTNNIKRSCEWLEKLIKLGLDKSAITENMTPSLDNLKTSTCFNKIMGDN